MDGRPNIYLDNKLGFTIRKIYFKDKIELEKLKNALTIIVKDNYITSLYNNKETKIFYNENNSKIYIPRFFGLKYFQNSLERNVFSIEFSDTKILKEIPFNCKLRSDQEEVVNVVVNRFNQNYFTGDGGILQLKVGFGKTVLAAYFVYKLKLKTIMIVDQDDLAYQSLNEINLWTNNALTSYLLKGSESFIQLEEDEEFKRNIDFLVIMIPTLRSNLNRFYQLNLMNYFGLTIFDECHIMGAVCNSRVFDLLQTRFILGLSATADRKDSTSEVLHWYMGDILYNFPILLNYQADVVPLIYFDQTLTEEIIEKYRNEIVPHYHIMKHLIDNNDRSKAIAKHLYNLFVENRKKNELSNDIFVLVLSEFREHLNSLYKILFEIDHDKILKGIETKKKKKNKTRNEIDDKNSSEKSINQDKKQYVTVGFLVGGMNKFDKESSKLCNIILGTYSKSSKGLNIPQLNVLYYVTPRSDVRQSSGRILRKLHQNRKPVIYDIIDKNVFVHRKYERMSYYERSEFLILEKIQLN